LQKNEKGTAKSWSSVEEISRENGAEGRQRENGS